ncbi:unnamed protein product [Adineta steineri]|uniref:NAD(P)(+)--arginine ADP-ribosyltransferase n=1 Tax=Adineta steineri TaxID=433720 RepID=A0A819CFH6_9BILA|nr:unnamed protein product [Adineta steineri]
MGQCMPKCLKPSISLESIITVVEDRATQTIVSSTISPRTLSFTRPWRVRIVQNFALLWLDSNIDELDPDFKYSLAQLRRIVNSIHTFTNPDSCVNFLNEIKNEKAFLLISGRFCQSVIPVIHDASQLDSIYIFCENKSKYEQWALDWTKIKGVFTQIETICDALKQDTQQCNYDSVSISVTSKNVDRLEPSFMYTQLLKEILLDMEYDDTAKTELVEFCREQFHDNPHELQIIDEFQRDYHVHTPIWWYTCECFTYQLLNRALRIQDVEIIIKMGFFLRDVHRHLEELHSKIDPSIFITVYRGKSMPIADFDEIKNRKDGLLAFNTFLSTSLNEEVSLQFAKKSLKKAGTIGVLFQITVDPSVPSTPFAPIRAVSAIPSEDEILFSMHTVFRIAEIKQIEERLWRVELTSTTDDDQDLKRLTEYMREEKSKSTKWEQLGYLLIKMGNFDKAEEIFHILLEQTFKDDEQLHPSLYSYLGDIKCSKGDYKGALEFYENSLEIRQKYPDIKPSDLVHNYNNIGLMHDNMAEYSKALEFYHKSFEIGEKSLPSNEISLAETCNNIGAAYCHLGDYTKALEFYEKSREICIESLPTNHPDLATVNSNIGEIHHRIKQYSQAVTAYEKTLEIRQKILPPNHPDLAIIHNSIGLLHCNMGEYSKALDSFQMDLDIKQKSLSQNHPNFAITYNNMGLVYSNMKDYAKALEFYQKSLDISLKSLPPNHPDLATTYNNIGLIHSAMGDYSKALEFIEKSLAIKEETLPSNHPDLAANHNNIGLIYWNMGEYSKALPYYERAVEIAENTLSQNDPALASILNTIGLVHIQMENYLKALEFLKKSLVIKEEILPSDHPDLANTCNHIGLIYYNLKEYSKALPYYERAVEIGQRALPPNHPYLQAYQNVLADVQMKCDVNQFDVY